MSKIGIGFFIPYMGLGYYRGYQKGKFDYKNALERFENRLEKYPKEYDIKDRPNFYTLDCVGKGLSGAIFYLLPPFCLFTMVKELYRLEIHLRGYENEKNKRDYYEIFP